MLYIAAFSGYKIIRNRNILLSKRAGYLLNRKYVCVLTLNVPNGNY
jgi:hypothetical protein